MADVQLQYSLTSGCRVIFILFLVMLAVQSIQASSSDVNSRARQSLFTTFKGNSGDAMCCATDESNQTVNRTVSRKECSMLCQGASECKNFNWKRPGTCDMFFHNPRHYTNVPDCYWMTGNAIANSPVRCSLPFTFAGQLYYGCMQIANDAEDHCNMSACIVPYTRELAICASPLTDFIAQYSTIDVNITTLNGSFSSVNGWIVIHQKLNDLQPYSLAWLSYKHGFGVSTSNYWAGLETMHQLTASAKYRLRVELQARWNLRWYSAEYDAFLIDSELGGYAIHVTGYIGDAGDSIDNSWRQNGKKFSTWDRDNDGCTNKNCALNFGGSGGWYNCCYSFLLTGTGGMSEWGSLKYVVGLPDNVLAASRMMIKAI